MTALAATPDGSWLASADWVGDSFTGKANLPVGPPRRKVQARNASRARVLCLSFSPDGRTLAVGTAVSQAAKGSAELQVWDTETSSDTQPNLPGQRADLCREPRRPPTRLLPAACAGEVFCEPLDGSREPGCCTAAAGASTGGLGGPGAAVSRGLRHRIPLTAASTTTETCKETFDPQRLAANRGEIAPADWLSPDRAAGGWTAKRTPRDPPALPERPAQGPRGPRCRLAEGRRACYCWVPDEEGRPFAIAVGTEASKQHLPVPPGGPGELPHPAPVPRA